MSNPTNALIELRRHYAKIIAQSQYRATQAKEQLEHVDALLLNGPILGKTFPLIALTEPKVLELSPTQEPSADLVLAATAEAIDCSEQKVQNNVRRVTSKGTRRSQSRESLSLLPEYKGLTKLEAISKVLSAQPGKILHQDEIIALLYGELSAEQLYLESRRMRASLFQGLRKQLWQRAAEQSSSYVFVAGEDVHLTGNASATFVEASAQTDVATKGIAKAKSGTMPKVTRLKPGRPPGASGISRKSKASLKEANPQPKKLEVVALLRKPSFAL